MANQIGVKLYTPKGQKSKKTYTYNDVVGCKVGDVVIVQTEQGLALGEVETMAVEPLTDTCWILYKVGPRHIFDEILDKLNRENYLDKAMSKIKKMSDEELRTLVREQGW